MIQITGRDSRGRPMCLPGGICKHRRGPVFRQRSSFSSEAVKSPGGRRRGGLRTAPTDKIPKFNTIPYSVFTLTFESMGCFPLPTFTASLESHAERSDFSVREHGKSPSPAAFRCFADIPVCFMRFFSAHAHQAFQQSGKCRQEKTK